MSVSRPIFSMTSAKWHVAREVVAFELGHARLQRHRSVQVCVPSYKPLFLLFYTCVARKFQLVLLKEQTPSGYIKFVPFNNPINDLDRSNV